MASAEETHRELLVQELKALCRGSGVLGPKFHEQLGPVTRAVAGVPETGSAREQRESVVAWLNRTISRLPAELALVGQVGFGLHSDARDRFLRGRLGWLSTELDREERTLRRRVDEAIKMVVEVGLGELADTAADIRTRSNTDDWYNKSVRALVLLNRPQPEIIEERTIAGAWSNLTLDLSLAPTPAGSLPELTAEFLYGGRLIGQERPSPSLLRLVVDLPEKPTPDSDHQIGIRYRLADSSMAPHYALFPHRPCASFSLRIVFPTPAPTVWHLPGVTTRSLDDPPNGLKSVELSSFGEAQVEFGKLRQGLGYGLRWTATGGGASDPGG